MRSSIRVTPALVAMALLATLLGADGCGLVTNTTAIQCTSQAECVGLGPEFADTTCDRETKTCKKLATAPECNTNSDCIVKNGAFNICRKSDKKCVQLKSPECPTVLGEERLLQNENTIVLGAITPVGSGELGDAIEKGAHLAQREIAPAETATGQGATGGRNPIVIVSCHEFNSDGFVGLLAAANHLVKNVQIPLMIGPVDPTDAQIVATNVTLPERVLGIFPPSIVSNLDSLPNPIAPTPLIWRLNYSDTQASNVVQAFVNNVLVDKLKRQNRLGAAGTDPVRIAIVSEGDYKGKQVGQVLTSKLTWNKKADGSPATCADNIRLNPSACIPTDFGSLNDTIGNPAPDGKISTTLAAVLTNNGSFAPPHIVIHSYATFGIKRILFPIEGAWDGIYNPDNVSTGKYEDRPFHIGLFSPWNTFAPMFGFMDGPTGTVSPSPKFVPMKERVFALYTKDVGDDPIAATNARLAYEIRYKREFPEFQTSASPTDVLPRQLYDAVYMAAFAIAALNGKPLTGSNLAATLPRLLQGQALLVGPDSLPLGVAALSDPNKGINLNGLSGSLDLDPKTGSPKYSLEISCPGVIQSTGASTNFVSSGYYYDEKTGVPLGTFPGGCPTLQGGKW